MNRRPPKFFIKFFLWFCRPSLQETILGDLEEQFDEDVKSFGPFKAKRRFAWNVLRFFRPQVIKKLNKTQKFNNYTMQAHYFKTGLRNIQKHKTFSLLNILGLAVGIAACLTILQYVAFESSYDQFHSRKDDIYRVDTNHFKDSVLISRASWSAFKLGPTIKSTVPGVETITRTHVLEGNAVVTFKEASSNYQRQFLEEEGMLYFVDQSFFDLFDYKVVKGNRNHLLEAPNSIVITEEMWMKYMPDVDDPVGETLNIGGGRYPGAFQITGVIETLPENTMYSFGFLMPMHDLLKSEQYSEDNGWGWSNFVTYAMTEPGASIDQIEEQARYIVKENGDEVANRESYVTFTELNDLHLRDETNQDGVTDETLSFFMIIAIFIIGIAWLNYINLSTAQAIRRAKEVGIRKTVGAAKSQLVFQFLLEAFIVNFIALLLAFLLTSGTVPLLNEVIGKTFYFGFGIYSEHWMVFFGAFVLGTILTGFYPALVLSRFKPSEIIKGSSSTGKRKFGLRQILVTAQLMIGVFLIAGTYTVHRQLQFMLSQNLGLNVDQVVSITAPMVFENEESLSQKMVVFYEKLRTLPAVSSVSASNSVPGGEYNWSTSMTVDGRENEHRQGIRMMFVDDHFHNTYDMELAAGRFHDPNLKGEKHPVVVNETLVKKFDLGTPEEAIGKKMRTGSTTFPIIGVLKDYHWRSLKQETQPILLYYLEQGDYVSVRISAAEIGETMNTIENEYKALFPDNPFSYDFMDDFFERQYQADNQFRQIFSVFSFIAIMIACLGLFGLASFTLNQRVKEIGIRKVLGARMSAILTLLYKDYMILIGLATIIVTPITYFALKQWLDDFAFRINITFDLFLVPVLMLAIIMILTISYQSFRAAFTNPASSLRSE